MKKMSIAAAIAGGLATTVIGLAAPALAAPSGPGSAQDTISKLQAQGYKVIVNRVGTTPLEQATVVSVRPGQTYAGVDATGGDYTATVAEKTVYVDVK
jgi:hypothetical protein